MPLPHDEEPHVRLLLGAYVLGGLTAGEERQASGHLQVCDACRTEYLELVEVQGLLSLITEADLLDGFDETPSEIDGRGGSV
ncbi:anti-sigma factor family protein [Streptomyces sp. NPDC048297]|uniref:anti-sigma factor family protein n=1 Tax=Streptomyces sp. NPDC048297 TaxID=3365531 RepID=UPI0037163B83